MTPDELAAKRTYVISLELYGYHIFLWRWWQRGYTI